MLHVYLCCTCALGLPWAMDRTASVYIAQGEFQRADILLQRASQRRVAVGVPLPKKDAQYLLSTGVLAALQGRFEEGKKFLAERVSGDDQAHLRGNTQCVTEELIKIEYTDYFTYNSCIANAIADNLYRYQCICSACLVGT